MKLLTVIVNYKTADMTLESTQAAVDAMIYIEGDWRIIIVDNDSQDGSFETIERALKEKCAENSSEGWENVTVVQSNHNGGFGAGNNYAIRKAFADDDQPEYVYLLNSDAFPEDNAVRLLTDYLDSHKDAGIAGSFIHGVDDEPHTTAFRFPSIFSELEGSMHLGFVSRLLRNYVVPIGIPKTTREVDWLAGASMMMRATMLKEIGLFDETFFLYFEETDLCRRAAKKNWKTVYVKESRVGHIGSVSTGMKTWERVPGYWLDSRKYYFCKNHGYLYAAVATLARLLGGMSWRIRAVIQKKTNTEPKHFLQDLLCHWFSR